MYTCRVPIEGTSKKPMGIRLTVGPGWGQGMSPLWKGKARLGPARLGIEISVLRGELLCFLDQDEESGDRILVDR